MPALFLRISRARSLRLLVAALLQWLVVVAPAAADDLADFHAVVERARDQHSFTMSVLETSSQQQTAAEVARLRQACQEIAERFGAQRPAAFADDEQYGGMFFQIDVSLVGVLLVIDLGSRDGARAGLTRVGETLTRLSERSAPPH